MVATNLRLSCLGKPYCCHLGSNGEECQQPPRWVVYGLPLTWDDYTHVCNEHLASQIGSEGVSIWPIEMRLPKSTDDPLLKTR